MLREVFEKGKELADKVTNVVMNYTEVEAKVRSATNDDPWGPHGQDMQEIAEYTKQRDTMSQVMGMLWRRMFQEQKSNWRRTYKSLLLLSYLLRNGSNRIVASCKEHVYDLKLLESYQFIDENGKDQGVNIRHKAKDLISLLENESQLSNERKKAALNRNKYQGGISSSINGHRYYSGGGSGDDNDDGMKTSSRNSPLPSTTNGVVEKAVEKKPVDLPKAVPVPEEPVADLLDLSSMSPPAQNLTQLTSQPDNTFDPFNLSSEPVIFSVPAVPSQTTSPIKLNNRYSDDFDNFVSAPMPAPSSISFNDVDMLFGNDTCTLTPEKVLVPTNKDANSNINSNSSQHKTQSIGATWSNVGSIDISLDLLNNRKNQTNPGVTSSRSLNQLQQQSYSKPGLNYSSNNSFKPQQGKPMQHSANQFVTFNDL